MTSEHPFEQLSPDTVVNAVEAAGLISDARILALNSYENRVYQVGIEDDVPVIVKFYRPGRWSTEQILEEHAFTLELAALDIPVVPPEVFGGGQTLLEYEGFRYSVFRRYGGRSPEFDNPDNLVIIGRFLGRIHAAGSAGRFSCRSTLGVEGHAITSSTWLLENDFIPAELVPAYESLSRDLISRLQSVFETQSSVKTIRIHGDCHIGNILWRDDSPHFVDFDDTLTGPAIQDLWMLLSGERYEQTAQLDELLGGYQEFYDFSPRELNLIEALRTLRIMHYSAWLARRWDDPAFPLHFPWFNTDKYWAEHILELREQLAALDEPPLSLF